MLDVGQAEVGAELGVGAGLGGDGDVFVGVGVAGDVVCGGFGGGCLARLVGGVGTGKRGQQKGRE